MKRFFSILLTLSIAILMLTGCSEKDSDNPNGIEELWAYSLDQFFPVEDIISLFNDSDQEDILEDNIEIRSLFSILVSAEDGWNWQTRGVRDLLWEEFAAGYLIPDDEGRVYFGSFSDQGINTYNVKYAEVVDVYRAFQLVKPDGTIAVYELNSMDSEMITNHDDEQEAAIKFSDFIPEEITKIDSVEFVAADGYQKTYSIEELNDGYWLMNSGKTIFPGFPDMPGSKKKFNFLKQIIVHGNLEVVEEPAFGNYADESDFQFTLPDNLTDYDYIIWE
jgi:hypothetical protein